MFTDMDYELEEDKLGIPTVPGTVTLKKDSQNLIGISIGGGAQFCPCLYIVQVFDNTAAALDGTLAAGDEITGVNGKPVKGKTKVEVAKMIQAVQGDPVVIQYNKLQADPKQGKSLDIVLKKVKHRLVENMSSGTADALGLSRAILCNGQIITTVSSLMHYNTGFYVHPCLFNARCLRVLQALGEPLYRVSTGNYEYRLILRCRQEARKRFAKMRKDVLEKIELLDQKHVQDIVFQLQRFVSGMSRYYDDCYGVLKEADVFPIEVDLSRTMINYSGQSLSYEDEEEEETGRGGEEDAPQAENGAEKLIDDE
uniref:PRKCA-binding protein n=1 Tax=Cyprinus carpio TaxID=7962 RepID=A0A8C1RD60_CYPCA